MSKIETEVTAEKMRTMARVFLEMAEEMDAGNLEHVGGVLTVVVEHDVRPLHSNCARAMEYKRYGGTTTIAGLATFQEANA